MVEPFVSMGWSVALVPMTADLSMDADALVQVVLGLHGSCLVYIAEYFGRQPSAALMEAAMVLRESGVEVLDDETHRVFHPGGLASSFAIGSLRKLLPVADGAYVRSEQDGLEVAGRTECAGCQRWAAMDMRAVDDGLTSETREAFVASNDRLEAASGMEPPCERTQTTIDHLNYEVLAARRVRNAEVLVELLDGRYPIINPPTHGTVPSNLVIRVEDPRRLQRALAEQRIFAPIHWPVSPVCTDKVLWPCDLLSLPIDHRYVEDDMERIASLLVCRNGHPTGAT